MLNDPSTEDLDADVDGFLSMVWDRTPDDWANYVWRLPASGGQKLSKWAYCHESTRRNTAKFVRGTRDGADLYIGCSPRASAGNAHQRTTNDQVAGLVCLWTELDVAGPGHEKGDLFADADEAGAFAAATWPEPTMVVHSGGGLHFWWFLDEPWVFDGEEDRFEAAALVRAWVGMGAIAAAAIGRTTDPVHDLARVLRIPGTFNHKLDHPRPVRTLLRDGPLLSLDAARAATDGVVTGDGTALLDASRREVALVQWSADGLDLSFDFDSTAPVPVRWDVAVLNDPSLVDAWAPDRDKWGSWSEQQMSLANAAAVAGFSAQEMCDLLVAQRREHGADLKESSKSYWLVTIGKALDRARTRGSLSVVASDDDGPAPAAGHPGPPAAVTEDLGAPVARVTALRGEPSLVVVPDDTGGLGTGAGTGGAGVAAVRAALRIPLARIEKHRADPPMVVMVFDDGRRADLGDLQALGNQRRAQLAILQGCDVLPVTRTANEWLLVVGQVWNAAEWVDLGEWTTVTGQVREMLRRYASTGGIDELATASPQRPVVRHDGRLYCRPAQLAEWMETTGMAKVASQRMGPYVVTNGLRNIGAERRTFRMADGEGATRSHTVWLLPVDWDLGSEIEPGSAADGV